MSLLYQIDDDLSVDQQLHLRLLVGLEAQLHFLQARLHHEDAALVLLPEEVVGGGVGGLQLPRHALVRSEFATLPDPASETVLLCKHVQYQPLLAPVCFLAGQF